MGAEQSTRARKSGGAWTRLLNTLNNRRLHSFHHIQPGQLGRYTCPLRFSTIRLPGSTLATPTPHHLVVWHHSEQLGGTQRAGQARRTLLIYTSGAPRQPPAMGLEWPKAASGVWGSLLPIHLAWFMEPPGSTGHGKGTVHGPVRQKHLCGRDAKGLGPHVPRTWEIEVVAGFTRALCFLHRTRLLALLTCAGI